MQISSSNAIPSFSDGTNDYPRCGPTEKGRALLFSLCRSETLSHSPILNHHTTIAVTNRITQAVSYGPVRMEAPSVLIPTEHTLTLISNQVSITKVA